MENEELRQIIELKAKNYFDHVSDNLLEWRSKKMITKYEYQDLVFSSEKNKKMFYSLLEEILK